MITPNPYAGSQLPVRAVLAPLDIKIVVLRWLAAGFSAACAIYVVAWMVALFKWSADHFEMGPNAEVEYWYIPVIGNTVLTLTSFGGVASSAYSTIYGTLAQKFIGLLAGMVCGYIAFHLTCNYLRIDF